MADIAAFQAASDSFMKWLVENGAVVSPDIELQDLRSEGRGRGVVATKDIVADIPVFRIPRSLILMPTTTTLPEPIRTALEDEPWLALIASMMHEHLLAQPNLQNGSTNGAGGQSFWAPYLDVLPDSFDTLMFWSKEELAWLQSSALRGKVGRETADKQFLEKLVPHFCSETQSHPNPMELSAARNLIHLAHVMGSRIMAYAFDIEPPPGTNAVNGGADEDSDDGYATDVSEADLPKGMVPLADMLNADADLNNARLFHTPEALEMRTIKRVAAGEELYNDYGPLPRSDLLRRYGYASDRYAQYDVAEITLDNLIPDVESHSSLQKLPAGLTATALKDRIDFLRNDLELDLDGFVISRAPPSGPDAQSTEETLAHIFDEELLSIVNTLFASEEQFARLQKKQRPASAKSPVPTSDEPTASLLRGALHRRLAEYNTTADADRSLLKNQMTERQRMAVLVRLGEKEVLQAALHALGKGAVWVESEGEDDHEPAAKRARTE